MHVKESSHNARHANRCPKPKKVKVRKFLSLRILQYVTWEVYEADGGLIKTQILTR